MDAGQGANASACPGAHLRELEVAHGCVHGDTVVEQHATPAVRERVALQRTLPLFERADTVVGLELLGRVIERLLGRGARYATPWPVGQVVSTR